eukprot:TRINITY_DN6587_c0_g1_i1.p1 TRINITY_DN6587_c0_g1~~TRINITY_DN6587_c0_g1_i1.p1  ORF type:complete len:326 (-),score=78.03 TRINITY_DN6587_c0_g1_i1:297-1274(-)
MDATLHVASLSGETLLQMQRSHLGEHATVAQLETLLQKLQAPISGTHRTSSDENDEEVMFMSAGEILEDESLLVDLPCQHDNPTIEIQRVVQKSLKFCLQINRGFRLVGVQDRPIERNISRKAAATMTVGELKALLFMKHANPMSQVNYDLTSDGAALVDTDKLTEIGILKDVEEVHLGLAAKQTMHYYVVIPGMAPPVGAAMQPLPQVVVQNPQAAALFLPQLLAQQPPNLAAAQPFAQAVPPHLPGPAPPLHLQAALPPNLAAVQQFAQPVPHLQGPAPPFHMQAALQHANMNAAAPSREERQFIMQQRLDSSLQQNRAVYFQ